jgi:hypothetical protein
VPLWVIPILVIFGGTFTISGVAGMVLQCGRRVKAPTTSSYLVVAGPSGLPWVSTLNLDARWIALPVHWVQWLRRHPRTWSVTVTTSRWDRTAMIAEEFPSRATAFTRFDEVLALIQSGDLIPDGRIERTGNGDPLTQ